MNQLRALSTLVVVVFLMGTTQGLAGKERDIPIAEVPEKILAAAKEAVPGIKITEAEVEEKRTGIVYEVEGVVDGKKYEINISEEGKVLRVAEDD